MAEPGAGSMACRQCTSCWEHPLPRIPTPGRCTTLALENTCNCPNRLPTPAPHSMASSIGSSQIGEASARSAERPFRYMAGAEMSRVALWSQGRETCVSWSSAAGLSRGGHLCRRARPVAVPQAVERPYVADTGGAYQPPRGFDESFGSVEHWPTLSPVNADGCSRKGTVPCFVHSPRQCHCECCCSLLS